MLGAPRRNGDEMVQRGNIDGAQCKSGDRECGQDTLGGFWVTSADRGARDLVLGQKPVAAGCCNRKWLEQSALESPKPCNMNF